MMPSTEMWFESWLMQMTIQDEDVPLIKPWMQHSRTLPRGAARLVKW